MGRQNGSDPTVLHYSIALLQERFRQLQRVKEMREERELLKMLAQAEHRKPVSRCEPFFHPDLILPCRPLQVSASIQSEEQLKLKSSSSREMPMLTRLRPDRVAPCTSNTCDDSDVDTSLHL